MKIRVIIISGSKEFCAQSIPHSPPLHLIKVCLIRLRPSTIFARCCGTGTSSLAWCGHIFCTAIPYIQVPSYRTPAVVYAIKILPESVSRSKSRNTKSVHCCKQIRCSLQGDQLQILQRSLSLSWTVSRTLWESVPNIIIILRQIGYQNLL